MNAGMSAIGPWRTFRTECPLLEAKRTAGGDAALSAKCEFALTDVYVKVARK